MSKYRSENLCFVIARGNEEWSRTYGGPENESGFSIQQTIDGGYVITGATTSFGSGGSGVWLLKIDTNGDLEF